MKKSVMLLCLLLCLCPLTSQAKSYKTGVCGVPLPTWGVRSIGKNRYATGYSTLDSILKYYRKTVFNYSNTAYLKKTLLTLNHVTSYHLKSLRSGTSWEGLNLSYYRRKRRVEIFVFCR